MSLDKIVWHHYMEVNEPHIDEDHKKLVEIINSIPDGDTHDKAHITKICGQLAHYAQYHFAREEKIMAGINYPDLKNHISIHSNFVNKVSEFAGRITKTWHGGYGSHLYLITNEWLIRHIMDEDRRVGIWARERKLVPAIKRRPLEDILRDLDRTNAFRKKYDV